MQGGSEIQAQLATSNMPLTREMLDGPVRNGTVNVSRDRSLGFDHNISGNLLGAQNITEVRNRFNVSEGVTKQRGRSAALNKNRSGILRGDTNLKKVYGNMIEL